MLVFEKLSHGKCSGKCAPSWESAFTLNFTQTDCVLCSWGATCEEIMQFNMGAIVTLISAINSSFFMFCFSVTRMPFSSRIVLQRGSTLSLISTVWMEIETILGGFSLRMLAGGPPVGAEWSGRSDGWMDGPGSCFSFFSPLLCWFWMAVSGFKTPPSYVDPPLLHPHWKPSAVGAKGTNT